MDDLSIEQKQAYRDHWENTERLVKMEKEWRLAQKENQSVDQLKKEIQKARILLEKSKIRAYQAALNINRGNV